MKWWRISLVWGMVILASLGCSRHKTLRAAPSYSDQELAQIFGGHSPEEKREAAE